MAARNRAERIDASQDREAESQRDAGELNPMLRKPGGENGGAAAAEGEPESTEKLSADALNQCRIHRNPLP